MHRVVGEAWLLKELRTARAVATLATDEAVYWKQQFTKSHRRVMRLEGALQKVNEAYQDECRAMRIAGSSEFQIPCIIRAALAQEEVSPCATPEKAKSDNG